jgi:hypothetical protein
MTARADINLQMHKQRGIRDLLHLFWLLPGIIPHLSPPGLRCRAHPRPEVRPILTIVIAAGRSAVCGRLCQLSLLLGLQWQSKGLKPYKLCWTAWKVCQESSGWELEDVLEKCSSIDSAGTLQETCLSLKAEKPGPDVIEMDSTSQA